MSIPQTDQVTLPWYAATRLSPDDLAVYVLYLRWGLDVGKLRACTDWSDAVVISSLIRLREADLPGGPGPGLLRALADAAER